jgi:hypothetical protein
MSIYLKFAALFSEEINSGAFSEIFLNFHCGQILL